MKVMAVTGREFFVEGKDWEDPQCQEVAEKHAASMIELLPPSVARQLASELESVELERLKGQSALSESALRIAVEAEARGTIGYLGDAGVGHTIVISLA